MFQLGKVATRDIARVDALTGAIEGRVMGETYIVSPRIVTTQAKIPAAFVKRMELVGWYYTSSRLYALTYRSGLEAANVKF